MEYFGSFGSPEEALSRLIPIIEKAIQAHQTGDYQVFSSIITPELKENITEVGFQKAHQEVAPNLGTLVSKHLLGSFRRGNDPMLVFAATYTNTQDDVLINVTFENGSNPPLIKWLWIE